MAISGTTRLLAIVGDPIGQVRSPAVYNTLLERAGRDAVLVPWHAPAGAFGIVMAGLMRTANLDGIIVTYPFKQLAYDLCAATGPMAKHVRAVNALRREKDGGWAGDMFDGIGLVRAMARVGESIAGRRVKLLGAGGAGSAIAFALAEAGAAAMSIYDPDSARAARLAQDLARAYPGCSIGAGGPALGDAGLLINATPVGLEPDDGLPVPLPTLCAATTVVDIVPRSDGTPLLFHAKALGCPHFGGVALVEGQAGAVLDFFGLSAAPAVA